MKTRAELIDAGEIWQVYPSFNSEEIYFEGNKTACKAYLKEKNLLKSYKKGGVRMGKVIWEEKS